MGIFNGIDKVLDDIKDQIKHGDQNIKELMRAEIEILRGLIDQKMDTKESYDRHDAYIMNITKDVKKATQDINFTNKLVIKNSEDILKLDDRLRNIEKLLENIKEML